MPETPDDHPRRLVHEKRGPSALHWGATIMHDGSVAATAAAVGSISMQTGLSIGGAHQPRRSRSELSPKGAGEVQLPQVGIANESDQVT